VGSFVNAVLALVAGVPTATAARCSLAGGFAERPAMCTPDFTPVFQHVGDGLVAMGQVLDNFVNMAYLVVVLGPDAECPTSSQANRVNLDWNLDPPSMSLFGSNTTLLIALAQSTSWVLTDGQHGVLIVHSGADVRRSYFPNLWGDFPVNPRYGIAALKTTKGLLGCSCLDDNGQGLVVQCVRVTASGTAAPATAFNVSWELGTAAQLLKCETVRILVQSIRWPERRLASAQPRPVLLEQRLDADAVVYVIPSCGSKGSNLMACFSANVLTLSNCFPFCMGVHLGPNQPLTLRGYTSWHDGVLVTGRDCVPVGGGGSGGSASSSSCTGLETTTAEGQQTQCAFSSSCVSWVYNRTLYPSDGISAGYAAHSSAPIFADTEDFVGLVLDGQPLVAAGGVVMRLSKNIADNQYYVDFPMLVGNQYNELTMEVASPAGVPLTPIAAVPKDTINSEEAGKITLPPNSIEMVDLYNPAALSTDAMWYAVNPSYDWLSALAKYCASKGQQSQVCFLPYGHGLP
jgi:hypothetical protein